MKVVVIGAGIIGMTTAWHLANCGYEVLVLDSGEGVACGSSFANGAQLSYGYVEPMASPVTLRQLPSWLFDPNAPLKFHWDRDWEKWRWCMLFLRECTASRFNAHRRQLFDLAMHSKLVMDDFLRQHDITLDFNYKQNGKLHLYRDEQAFSKARVSAKEQTLWGYLQEIWDVDACVKHEPMLASETDIAGGIFSPQDAVGDSHHFAHALRRLMKEKGLPVSYQFGVNCRAFLHEHGDIRAVQTEQGVIEGDKFIVAAGVGSRQLLKSVNITVPIYPVKGYSITVPRCEGAKHLRMNITDRQRKMVFAPLGKDHLRVAGIAELAGYDNSIAKEAVSVLKDAVKQIFTDCYDIDRATCWAGFRPMTPNGLPILGKYCYNNLYLNIGQGMLGWTLSQGCASLVVDAVEGKPPPSWLKMS